MGSLNKRGSSSILVIFAVLLLSVLGMLTLMSSHAGLKLAEKNADWRKEVYVLESSGAEVLAEIYECLKRAEMLSLAPDNEGVNEFLYFNNAKRLLTESDYLASIISFRNRDGLFIDLKVQKDNDNDNDNTDRKVWLNISVKVLPPGNSENENKRMEIVQWKYESEGFTYDSNLKLWEGNLSVENK